MNDLLLRACRREAVERPPVWMMRQAGRYLPEYRKVRERADFLTMVGTPELAVEVTLQPVDILGVDAAIIFSDILVVPQAMGMHLSVDESTGPRFHQPLRTPAEFAGLRPLVPEEGLGYVLEAIRLARRELEDRVPLIGFAGAPWTLASYMIEGGGSKNFALAKRLLVEDPDRAHGLLSRLAKAVGTFLKAQVAAGAQAVQLFDSWAGILSPADYREFALRWARRVFEMLRESPTWQRRGPVPIIYFTNGCAPYLDDYATSGADVLGVDWRIDIDAARRGIGDGVALQGNMDPGCLFLSPREIRDRVAEILAKAGPIGHIFNLGHGVLPETNPEHVRAMVNAVRELSSRTES